MRVKKVVTLELVFGAGGFWKIIVNDQLVDYIYADFISAYKDSLRLLNGYKI